MYLSRSDIHFLNDYLNLEKVRRDHSDYNITEEGNIDAIQLPALLFIPFVENAVKHNFDSEHPSYVHLSFKVEDNQLEFQCGTCERRSNRQKPCGGNRTN